MDFREVVEPEVAIIRKVWRSGFGERCGISM
jgi:hypothetical protein